jgi:hypothetical protein
MLKKKRLLTQDEKEHDRRVGCIVSFAVALFATSGLMVDFYDPEPLLPDFSNIIFKSVGLGVYNDQQFTNEYYIKGDTLKHPENKISGSWLMIVFVMFLPLILSLIGYDKEGKKIDKEKVKRGVCLIRSFVAKNRV